MMLKTKLDHIVIGAASLRQGVAFVKERLGVEIPSGGEHPAMGTHNHLMQLGNDVFLEIIAVNPVAPAPARPRWYGLDDPCVGWTLTKQPQLLTWVVNTADIKTTMSNALFSFGDPVRVSRGELNWLFGIPDDGRLLAGGMLPYLIQWQTHVHPAGRMMNLGCRLRGIAIYHPHVEWLASILSSIDAEQLITLCGLPTNETPYLAVEIDTPTGLKTLRTCG